MKNVVFYSKCPKDKLSEKLLSIMTRMPFAREFLYCQVDKDRKYELNKDLFYIMEVDKVPTMFVDGKKLDGEQAFAWLEYQYTMVHGQQQQQPQTMRLQQHSQPPMPMFSQQQQQQQPDEGDGFLQAADSDEGGESMMGAFFGGEECSTKRCLSGGINSLVQIHSKLSPANLDEALKRAQAERSNIGSNTEQIKQQMTSRLETMRQQELAASGQIENDQTRSQRRPTKPDEDDDDEGFATAFFNEKVGAGGDEMDYQKLQQQYEEEQRDRDY